MMKRGYDRTQRVGDLIQQTLAQLLLEAHDDRFKLVTVTSVSVSRDLSYAKVYVGVLMDDPNAVRDTMTFLNKSVKSFRFQLAKVIKLRIVPDLKFIYDEASAHGFKISGLIQDAMKKADS